MIDLNYHDTQKIVRDLLEHKIDGMNALLPAVTERMSEESLDDSRAFSDLSPISATGGRRQRKSRNLSEIAMNIPVMEPLQEQQEEEEDEDDDDDGDGGGGDEKKKNITNDNTEHDNNIDKDKGMDETANEDSANRESTAPPNSNGATASTTISKNKFRLQKQPQVVSMPNIYAVRLTDDGTSGSYYDVSQQGSSDLLTDHKGICDLDYDKVQKVVQEVLHHNPGAAPPLPSVTESNGETDADAGVATAATAAAAATAGEEGEARGKNESAPKKEKKGLFQRLKSSPASFKKKVLQNP